MAYTTMRCALRAKGEAIAKVGVRRQCGLLPNYFWTFVIRPHRMHLMYHVLSVSLLDTTVNHAKTAEPIEVLFGIWTRMGPRNHVLQGGGADLPGERAILEGLAHRALRCDHSSNFFDHLLDRGPNPPLEGACLGTCVGSLPIAKYTNMRCALSAKV